MKNKLAYFSLTAMLIAGCQSDYYNLEDFSAVLKIDSHIHINSDDGAFENQAALWD
jgi:hypothetical protein